VSVAVARLSDQRHVDISYDSTGCVPGVQLPSGFTPFADADVDEGEVIECPDGPALSLFPASFTYVRATVIDPNAEFWDPVQATFVTGPLESNLFYQFSGIVPDLNENGVDDLLDIREGDSTDDNSNGIPDEAESGKYAVSVRLGSTFPHTSAVDPGISFNLGLEYYLTTNVTIEGVLGYHDFDVSGLSGNATAWQLSVNTRYYGPQRGRTKFFLNGGIGGYVLDPGSTTEFGVNLGAGLDWELRSALAFEAAYNYHQVDPGGASFEFSTLQIGLRWEL
jgi:hypothetical protein